MSDQWDVKVLFWESFIEWIIEVKVVCCEFMGESVGQFVLDCVGYLIFWKVGCVGLVMDDCGLVCVLCDVV